jgi:cytidylate kinase
MTARTERRIIAIDGPAGAGKSTVARLIADELGLAHLDTGSTYRVVAKRALDEDVPLTDGARLGALAERVADELSIDTDGRLRLNGSPVGEEIRTAEVSQAASVVAAHPEVRRVLVRTQRRLVPERGAVIEGRDIGTVVWPNADVKAYLDASEDVRAQRRAQDTPDAAAVRERDRRDAGRPVGAMRPAPDAFLIDTTAHTPDEVARLVVERTRPPPRPNRSYRVFRSALAGLAKGPFRLEVHHPENIPSRGAAIIAANHRSLIDIPILGALTKRQIWFMAKEELFASKRSASFFERMGAFPVKRGKPDRRALQRAFEVLADGELLGLFPEGTRRPMSRFEEVEEGLAYVALKSGAPVVPVAISGTEAVLPKGRRFPRFVKIRVFVGEPFWLGGPVQGVLPRTKIREATDIAKERLLGAIQAIEP